MRWYGWVALLGELLWGLYPPYMTYVAHTPLETETAATLTWLSIPVGLIGGMAMLVAWDEARTGK